MAEKKNILVRRANPEKIRRVKVDINCSSDQFTNFLNNSKFYSRLNEQKKKSTDR